MKRPIYLDYNATTPVDPLVLEVMLPYLREAFGNASSMSHSFGWEANQAVSKAREQVASLIDTEPSNIIWTSGATESNNIALLSPIGYALTQKAQTHSKPHLITSRMEHKAVLDVARHLESEGAEVTYLSPDRYGQIQAHHVEKAIQPNTVLVSIIAGQNEIGTLNPISEIGHVILKANANREQKILFHVDAAQAVGKSPISVKEWHVDLLSASGHKIYAPKGVGFLFVRENLKLDPLFFGGSQEHGLRPGTLNVPGIVALGKACEICQHSMVEEIRRLTELRDQFIARVLQAIPTARLNGHPTSRLYSNVSFSFAGLDADVFAIGISGLAMSSGSACAAGAPSHILAALGLSEAMARATIRIGLGRFTTAQDLEIAAEKIIAAVSQSLA